MSNIGLFRNAAGGNLAAWLSQYYDQKIYEILDEADQVSCHPDFAVLQYAAYFQGRKLDKDFDTEFLSMKK